MRLIRALHTRDEGGYSTQSPPNYSKLQLLRSLNRPCVVSTVVFRSRSRLCVSHDRIKVRQCVSA
nr:MAG TPA: hypothetical protein [Caudoviricetes sp.]